MLEGNFDCLRILQNDAAGLIVGLPHWVHATPVRTELHWLPVRSRVNYKVLSLAYKALRGAAPLYINNWFVGCFQHVLSVLVSTIG